LHGLHLRARHRRDGIAEQDEAEHENEDAGQKQRQGFRYISEVDWDDGAYEVTYYTTDKAKVEIRYDPVTGEPK
jgi:hypothetical protein